MKRDGRVVARIVPATTRTVAGRSRPLADVRDDDAMAVDVTTEITIARPLSEVWAYAVDPGTAPQWYANIDSVDVVTEPPLRLGSRMTFRARFLGRVLTYTYEVVELDLERAFTMTTHERPFPMTTTYRFATVEPNLTRMALRDHGEPRGFGAMAAPLMVGAMRRANRADLARLKQVLERHSGLLSSGEATD